MKINLSNFDDFLDFCPGIINNYFQEHYEVSYPKEEFYPIYKDPKPGFYYAIYLINTAPQFQFNLTYHERLQEVQLMALKMDNSVYSYNVSPKSLESGEFKRYITNLDNRHLYANRQDGVGYWFTRKFNGLSNIEMPKSMHSNPFEAGEIFSAGYWIPYYQQYFPLTKEQLNAYGFLNEEKKEIKEVKK